MHTFNQPKKILVISGVFPSDKSPQLGSFVKESSEILKKISNAEFYYAVSKNRPYNDLLVFFKHFGILIKSLFLCLKHKPHFIIAHTLFPIGFEALIVSKLFNIKIIVFAHGGDVYGMSKKRAVLWQRENMNYLWKMRFALIKRVIQNADGIIYVSDYLYDLAKKYFQAKENKSLISPIGYNPNLFYRDRDIKQRSESILYVGRIDEKKGIYKFFNILSSISNFLNENNYSVKIIGRIEDEKFYGEYKKQKKLYNLEYLGEKKREELPALFNSSKITIVPSFYEAFGLVAVESIACGTPVACYPVGGLVDVIVENYSGIFLDIENDYKSGEKIVRLLKNIDKLEKLSSNGEESAKKYDIYHTQKNNWSFINNIYNKNK